ncbi:hypothetical protein KIU71_11835 [Alteromonas sp. SM 2104]|nr:hypothetical protein [Alteromonas oceanisediminis]
MTKTTPNQTKKKSASANAAKQKRFRDRQKAMGKKMVRGYISPQAMRCYKEISQITQWNDSDVLSNSLRLTYAAYKCGQIGLLTKWLKDHEPAAVEGQHEDADKKT